jgi:hypothetical protein
MTDDQTWRTMMQAAQCAYIAFSYTDDESMILRAIKFARLAHATAVECTRGYRVRTDMWSHWSEREWWASQAQQFAVSEWNKWHERGQDD